MSILIAIDGVDASGKETQTRLLCEHLRAQGKQVRRLSFPNYESESSSLVRQYLRGDFGDSAQSVNAYAASMFFAADRFGTFRQDWEKDYRREDMILIADRYVSSNMIHQAGKISDAAEKEAFLEWLEDFEYQKLELPRPDKTIFLDMPPEYAAILMKSRANKIDGSQTKDIHEKDSAYLQKSYENACFVAEKYGWHRIICAGGGSIKTVEDIQGEIREAVIELTASV